MKHGAVFSAVMGGFGFASNANGLSKFLQLCGANAAVGGLDGAITSTVGQRDSSASDIGIGIGIGAVFGCIFGAAFDWSNQYKPDVPSPTPGPGASAIDGGELIDDGIRAVDQPAPNLTIRDQGFNQFITTADGGFVILRREGGTVVVEQITRGTDVSGNRLLAEAVGQTGGVPDRIVLENVINNETLATFAAGGDAADSVLGNIAQRAAGRLGVSVISSDFVVSVDGKIDILIELGS